MAFTYKDLQNEVKRRATMNNSGTQFDDAVKNIINTSLFRINRDAPWRVMRRKSTFDTVTTYTEGSGAGSFTNDSKDISVTGATFITDGIKIGRMVKLSGSSIVYRIKEITSQTDITLDIAYDGTTTTTGTYEILAQEEYNLPIQSGHRMFMWHEFEGYPIQLQYMTDQEFYSAGFEITEENTPIVYRMWGEDMVNEQLLEPSVISIVSSSASDTNIDITVFGIVSGYPDYEVITTDSSDGTTPVAGSKSFTSVERVVKGSSSVGRITASGNSGNATVAVLPVGDTTAGHLIRKIQLFPLPNKVRPLYIQYYKDVDRLVNDNDTHELGKDFDEAIILLSVAKIKAEQNQQESDRFLILYKDEIRSLKKTNMDKIDYFPTLKRPYNAGAARVHPQLQYRQAGSYFGPAKRY